MFVNQKQTTYGNLEFHLAGADPTNSFAQQIGEFLTFDAGSTSDSELVRGAGGVLYPTEGNNMPGDASMTWLRLRWLRFLTAVVPEGGRLGDLTFALTIVEKLRQTNETHREGWTFQFQGMDSSGDASSTSANQITIPVLLCDHHINGRRM